MPRGMSLALAVSLGVHGALVGWLVLGGWNLPGDRVGNVRVMEMRLVAEETGEVAPGRHEPRAPARRPIASSPEIKPRLIWNAPETLAPAPRREIPGEMSRMETSERHNFSVTAAPEPLGRAGEAAPSPATSMASPPSALQEILAEIRSRIKREKTYPSPARREGIEGTTTVGFRILSGGEVEGLRVLRSSGSSLLDEASLEAVRRAAPLPRVEGEVRVSLVFRLRSF